MITNHDLRRIYLALTLLSFGVAIANSAVPERSWSYTLLPGSYLIDECPPCARPTIPEPVRGTFDLQFVEETALGSRYTLENISFTAGSVASRNYQITGHGTYLMRGGGTQELSLTVRIHDGITNRLCYFTNAPGVVERGWPIIQVALDQTNGTLAQVYYLNLLAAPFREIWFSTGAGFTSSHWQPPTNRVSPGALLSSAGKVVQSNFDLTRNLGIMPVTPDLGLDGVDVLPNGEIVFSIEEDVFSETLGPLQHGDLLAARGRMLRRNQELYGTFSPMPLPAPSDVGLDAVQVLDNGEIYFSIETNVFSEALGVLLTSGDLLSSSGRIIKNNAQLLARFAPTGTPRNYGLDAVHAWPGGEIWFSLEEGFQDANLGPILPGDMLSDHGVVVFRNLELVNPFAPVEDLADFGLDAFALIGGETPPPPSTNRVWHYNLTEGSQLVDDCLICGRPAIVTPLRGGFDLRLTEENPLFSSYALENVAFKARSLSGSTYELTGRGTYQIGGEVALRQEMFLELYIDDGQTYKLAFFTNETSVVDRRWPMIQITLDQTNGTLFQTYTLELAAAPIHELWFSTAEDFHAGAAQSSNLISAGDLISSKGRVVKRNEQLLARLPLPSVNLGLDALDILPGGEIAISTANDGSSLRHGDVLFSRSGTVLPNADLLRPITRTPPPYDLGLDALHVASEMQFYFSVRSNFIIFNDPEPVVTIRRGDLLFSDLILEEGRVAKRNSELLERFHPVIPGTDVGLDAFYLWPSGEIWFSTEDPFEDQQLGAINAGDLLSDQGYIVYRNLELVSAFEPVERLADFGLDALFVVTDVAALAPGPRLTRITRPPATQVAHLEWQGVGRVWQLMRATDVAGPWLPIGGITPDSEFTDTSATASQSFYRLRQW